jgi:hypothetical protein
MDKDIKHLISKDNIQSVAMIGLLITSIQLIYLVIKYVITLRRFK